MVINIAAILAKLPYKSLRLLITRNQVSLL
jgi:hypothetical protein